MSELRDKIAALMFRENISVEEILEAQALKRSFFPPSLFKYRGCSPYSFENLRTRSLYCATADTFNDPYDSAINFNTPSLIDDPSVQEQLALIGEDELITKQAIVAFLAEQHAASNQEMVERFNKFIQSSYKICSLSERVDSLLMWGHYGAHHAGFAMEYDYASVAPTDFMSTSLWPVFYGDQLFDASKIFSKEKKDGFNNLFAIASAMHKAADWAYEKEWRIIIADGPTSPSRSFRAPLKAVYLGSKISDLDESILLGLAGEVGIPVYKMRLSRHEFKMESVLLRENNG